MILEIKRPHAREDFAAVGKEKLLVARHAFGGLAVHCRRNLHPLSAKADDAEIFSFFVWHA